MAVATLCVPIEVLGGADPQTIAINSGILSGYAATNTVTAYYTVNNGPQGGVQTFTGAGPHTYADSAAGVVTGDVVSFCIDADVDAGLGDTGTIEATASFMQTDADACSKEYPFSELCNWTAIDPNALDCSELPDSIECSGLPYVPSVTNATSYTVTFSGTDYSFDGTQITGTGGTETATITASNGVNSCTKDVTINACSQTTGPIAAQCVDVDPNPFEDNIHCGVGDQGQSPLTNTTSETICGYPIRAFGSGEGGLGPRGTIVILESATPLTQSSVTTLQVNGGAVVNTSTATFTSLGGNLYQWAWNADVLNMGGGSLTSFTVTYDCP